MGHYTVSVMINDVLFIRAQSEKIFSSSYAKNQQSHRQKQTSRYEETD